MRNLLSDAIKIEEINKKKNIIKMIVREAQCEYIKVAISMRDLLLVFGLWINISFYLKKK